MTQPTYKIEQWKYGKDDPRYMKWFVVGYNIVPSVSKYLREDGTWQDVMTTSWLPNGGTYFTTRNDAEIALSKTGITDVAPHRGRAIKCLHE